LSELKIGDVLGDLGITSTDVSKNKEKKPQRGYDRELSSKPIEMEIKEKDGFLCKILKRTLNESKLNYGFFIGKESINYPTFYSIRDKGSVTFQLLERFVRLMGKEVEIHIKDKATNTEKVYKLSDEIK